MRIAYPKSKGSLTDYLCPALVALGLCPLALSAQLQALPDKEPQRVFAGQWQPIAVWFHNPRDVLAEADLHTRVYQASSATAAPWGEAPWKTLAVLPGQTVLESASLAFPPVRTETRFLVQWLESSNKVAGMTEVLVYPPDVLKDLKPLAGEEPLGVFDPLDQLKPLLKAAGLGCQDLEETGLENFHGKLAILGPFSSQGQMQESLKGRVKALARKGVAVVWVQPPPEERPELEPSFCILPEGKGAVVVVLADLVANLPDKPQAQLNLVQLARLALNPKPLRLPQLPPSP